MIYLNFGQGEGFIEMFLRVHRYSERHFIYASDQVIGQITFAHSLA